MRAGSNLEKILELGQFALTCELGPPRGTSRRAIETKGELLRDYCDAINVTDNQTAIVRMGSLPSCVILREMGLEPVLQITTRDRNRLAIQSDLLGAVALGVQNVLCLSGDHPRLGDHPQAKGVWDLDSIQLIQALKQMRDERRLLSGNEIRGEVPLFIGAAANPFADPFELRVLRLEKKIEAGADFIQTQAVFDLPRFKRFMEMVRDRGLDERVHILAGVIPPKSAGMARYMRDYVAGVLVPDEVVRRMEDAKDAKEEGIAISLEIIEQILEIPGVHGIHIMAVGWEEVIPEIVSRARLLPRPIV
ncbi:TPA: methylenetetrahydrofolate reductase [Candidatus Bipolaricaulota bacterium]|nr:methylenetetrahydrofolate reductase [Candidatus Bipolaricaulota bacterium]